jgi:AraC family transcriptional regulator
VLGERLARVLAHIGAHPDGDLRVQTLSRVAGLSPFHFHRQFSGELGVGVHQYVKLVRLRRASTQLAFRAYPILAVALDNGFESHEAFSRAFSRAVGQTPSAFRAKPSWAWLQAARDRLRVARVAPTLTEVRCVDFPSTRVAALEHRGDLRTLGDSIRQFIAWRKQHRLGPSVSATYNLIDDQRFELCAATTRLIEPNPQGVIAKTIAGGRCAALRHRGADAALFETVRWLRERWLPTSGERLRAAPLVLQRLRLFPEVPEAEAVTDVFLPLEPK